MVQPYGQIKKQSSKQSIQHKKSSLEQEMAAARELTQQINQLTGYEAVKLMKEALDESTPDQVRGHINDAELVSAIEQTQFGKDLSNSPE